jgi:hypothetical protein
VAYKSFSGFTYDSDSKNAGTKGATEVRREGRLNEKIMIIDGRENICALHLLTVSFFFL